MFLLQHFLHKSYDIFLTKIQTPTLWIQAMCQKISFNYENSCLTLQVKHQSAKPHSFEVISTFTNLFKFRISHDLATGQVTSQKGLKKSRKYFMSHMREITGRARENGEEFYIPCRYSVSTTPNCVLPSRSAWSFTK